MNVKQMQARWDEINDKLEAIHDELTADGRPTEQAVAAAQAPLIEERKQLEHEFAAMRRADAEAEQIKKEEMAIFA